jgi:chorismate mutase
MENLKTLREKIDKIDAEIIKKLAVRQKISLKIGLLKSISEKQIKDPVREKKQKQQYEQLCAVCKIDFHFVNKVFKLILSHSRNLQKNRTTKHNR